MAYTADGMIAALNAFTPRTVGEANVRELYRITEGFEDLADRRRLVPAMFELMERFPEAELGRPGPLVHCIETLPTEAYEALLLASVRRQPVELNVWMVNRILNEANTPQHREALLGVLRSVRDHPRALDFVRELAGEFLELQAEEH